MTELRYTVVTDGSSDVALIPILTWLLRANGVAYAIQPTCLHCFGVQAQTNNQTTGLGPLAKHTS